MGATLGRGLSLELMTNAHRIWFK